MSKIFCVAFAFVALASCVNAADDMVDADEMCDASTCSDQQEVIKNFSGDSVIVYLNGSKLCYGEKLQITPTSVKFIIPEDGTYTSNLESGCYESVDDKNEHSEADNYDRDTFYALNCAQMVVNIQCENLLDVGSATSDRYILVKKTPETTPETKCCYEAGLEDLKNRFGLTYDIKDLNDCVNKYL